MDTPKGVPFAPPECQILVERGYCMLGHSVNHGNTPQNIWRLHIRQGTQTEAAGRVACPLAAVELLHPRPGCWVRRFVLFHGRRHSRGLGVARVEAFLTQLAGVNGDGPRFFSG